MPHQDHSIRFVVRARTQGAAAPESIATDLNRLREALATAAEEMALEAQDGHASPQLMGTWRDAPAGSSTVPGVVYDYSAQSTGGRTGASLNLPQVKVYFARDQWLAAVSEAAQRFIDATTPLRRIR